MINYDKVEWKPPINNFFYLFLLSPGDTSGYRSSDGAQNESTPIQPTQHATWSSTPQ